MANVHLISFRVGESNFNYLLHAEGSQRAISVDPLDGARVYEEAKRRGLEVRWIFNTHGHLDHVQGNAELVKRTGAAIVAGERESVEAVSKKLGDGDVWEVEGMQLRIHFTPGHTAGHVCAVVNDQYFICGDTLFLGGCGNCKFGGDPDRLFESLEKIAAFSDNLLVFCGHDYAEKNLRFCHEKEPSNAAVVRMQERLRAREVEMKDLVSTLADEKAYNVFLRAAASGDRAQFKALRAARDTF